MRTAVCPGSFDPVTCGHVDVISRAAELFDEVTVAVLANESKAGLFEVEERMEMLSLVLEKLPTVTVMSFSGLLVDFCRRHEVTAVVKGLRTTADFGYELQMAQMNARIAGVETVLLPTSPQWSFVSSTLVKEVAAFGGDVSGLVPSEVLERLKRRLAL